MQLALGPCYGDHRRPPVGGRRSLAFSRGAVAPRLVVGMGEDEHDPLHVPEETEPVSDVMASLAVELGGLRQEAMP